MTVAPLNGFTGPVQLTATGLPTGATASFNPASLTTSGSSTLTVATASTTPAGTATLTVNSASGSLSHTASLSLVVSAPAQPPSVSAGPAQTITLPASAQLSGSATSSNSTAAMTYAWKMTSGPGTATFTNASAASTSVSFSAAGTYVLTLTATSSGLSASAQTTITVKAAAAPVTNPPSNPAQALPDVQLPPNTGYCNVKSFGAVGDGSTDDTAAIQAAMQNSFNGSCVVVYFPAGTYLVSNTLSWSSGPYWYAHLAFWGENAATTTIRLKDNSAGFQSACNPMYPGDSPIPCKAVIYTANSGTSVGGAGGLWPTPTGAGENGYWNDIHDMTIDTGSGNPGAEGIDWTDSNMASIRNVIIQGSGTVALNTSRGNGGGNGPGLVKNLQINGSFAYGVVTGQGEVGTTFEHVYINNPSTIGFWNDNQNVWIRDLEVTTSGNVPAVQNDGQGNMTLIDSIFNGSGGSSAVLMNSGWLFARNIASSGFNAAISGVSGTNIAEYSSGGAVSLFQGSATTSLNLPIPETPALFQDNNFSDWAVVTDYGAACGNGVVDSTAAIQAALNAGKSTVYFPGCPGTGWSYYFSGTLHIPSGVRRILSPYAAFNSANSQTAVFESDATSGGSVEIRNMIFGFTPGGVQILNSGTQPLIIEDVFNLLNYSNVAGTGAATYIENAAIIGVNQHGGNVWARQLDTEGGGVHVENDGATFWTLGWKTEGGAGNSPGLWYTHNGGTSEILGEFNSSNGGSATGIAFGTVDSSISVAGASVGYSLNPAVSETRNGNTQTYTNGNRYGGAAISLYSGH